MVTQNVLVGLVHGAGACLVITVVWQPASKCAGPYCYYCKSGCLPSYVHGANAHLTVTVV